jgi:RNA polymerase sigma factor (sigma-70 family)
VATTADKEKLFRKFRGGDLRALSDLVDIERPELYEYLMRMTGEVSRSADTIDEVVQSVSDEALHELNTPLELRMLLYATARRLSADIWNADTSRLKNAALEQAADGDAASEQPLRERQAYLALDKALRNLGGREREVVTLRSRCNFEFYEIGDLLGLSADAAEQVFLSGMQRVDAECSGAVVGPESALQRMPAHPLPERTSQATMNLSMVMEGIKTKPVGLRSPARLLAFAAVLVFAAAYYLYPEFFKELAASVMVMSEAEKAP